MGENQLEYQFRRLLKKDDYRAFEIIFKHYYAYLCNFALRYTTNREDAENIVSEVFYKIWKNRKKIKIATSLNAYLFTSVRNQALDHLRKATVIEEPVHNLNFELNAKASNPEQVAIFNELESIIEEAIEQLPEQRRLIFKLNREEGLKYREIAERLKISVKTVETQMGRSLKFLRKTLQNEAVI